MNNKIVLGIVLFLLTVASAFAADELTIADPPGLPGVVPAEPGETAETSFILQNSGNTTLDLTVSPLTLTQGGESFSGTVTPAVLTEFLAGTQLNVDISIDVPDNQFAGTYSGLVEITGGDATASFTLEVDVNEALSADLNDLSITVTQGNTGDDELTVTNTGNANIGVDLTVTTLTGINPSNILSASSVSFEDNSFGVAFGGSFPTDVTVSVPSSQALDTYTGTISCDTCGPGPTTSTITVIVEAPLPSIELLINELAFSEKPGQGFSGTVTVRNTGTIDLSDLNAAFSGLSGFNISTNPTTFNLNASQSKVVEVKGTLPEDVDTRDSPFTGSLTFSNAQASAQMSISLNAESQLEIDRVDIYINNKAERVDDGDNIDRISPGDTIRFKIRVENTWSTSRDEDKDIENVEATLFIENIDDEDDIDEDLDVGDINPRDKETVEYEFEVRFDTDEDKYDGYIIVEAEDDDGANHYARIDFTLEVERERDDIRLQSVNVQPAVLSCDRDFSVDLSVINVGRDTQRNVVLEVKSTQLGINEQETGIRLDDDPSEDDNEFDKRFFISLPDTTKPGTYRLNINAYLDRTVLDDFQTVDLLVQECATDSGSGSDGSDDQGTSGSGSDGTGDNVQVVIPPVDISDVGVIAQPIEKEEKFTDSTAYVVLLGAILLLLVIGVIGLLVMLFKK